MSISWGAMDDLLRGLHHVLASPVWDARSSAAWQALTHTPADHAGRFEHCVPDPSTMLLCYKKVETDNCAGKLTDIVESALEGLRALRAQSGEEGMRDVYGTAPTTSLTAEQLFPPARPGAAPRPAPLTNAEMERELRAILGKITGPPACASRRLSRPM